MASKITNDSLSLFRCVHCECVTILSVGHPQGKCQCGREFYPMSRSVTEGEPMTLEQVCGEALEVASPDEVERLTEENAKLRDKWLRAVAEFESYRKRQLPGAEASAPGAWTVEGTRANSSAKYHEVVSIVEDLIRKSAFDLIAGRADSVAGLIVSNLAFGHGIGPMKSDDSGEDESDDDDYLHDLAYPRTK